MKIFSASGVNIRYIITLIGRQGDVLMIQWPEYD